MKLLEKRKYVYAHFSPAISSNIYHYFNNTFHEFKVPKKLS